LPLIGDRSNSDIDQMNAEPSHLMIDSHRDYSVLYG
jgi:hypothetical protein